MYAQMHENSRNIMSPATTLVEA